MNNTPAPEPTITVIPGALAPDESPKGIAEQIEASAQAGVDALDNLAECVGSGLDAAGEAVVRATIALGLSEEPLGAGASQDGAAPPVGLVGALQAHVLSGVDVARDALGDLAQSGATDQLRGYANETVGRAKMALGLAAQSPELTVAGVAQMAVGGVQRMIGEAKGESEDGDEPAAEDERPEAE